MKAREVRRKGSHGIIALPYHASPFNTSAAAVSANHERKRMAVASCHSTEPPGSYEGVSFFIHNHTGTDVERNFKPHASGSEIGKSRRLTNLHASSAPWSRSMEGSLHSTARGPS